MISLLLLLKGSSHGTWADMIHLSESPVKSYADHKNASCSRKNYMDT